MKDRRPPSAPAPGPAADPAADTAAPADLARIGPRPVARRIVFYIPGYDPFPPRRYRELYRKEGRAQARISGYALSLAPDGAAGWRVRAQIDGASTETQVEVLGWSDLVQASMGGSVWGSYRALWRTARVYLGSGAFWRLMRLRKGPTIAALYPVVVLLLQGALALGLMVAAAAAGAFARPGWGWALGLGLGVVLAAALLRWFRALDGRLFAHYLMHDYAFTAQEDGAIPAALSARLDSFRARLGAAMESGVDEVLLVGHSSGAHLGVTVLADLLRAGLPPGRRPALSFLTLGQVVPMASFLPRAVRLRADLAHLAAAPEITWVDVTAPGDGCAFALCDPVAVSGVAPAGARWPLVLSAAFRQTLAPQTWAALRWRFFRLHFQYLCAFDRPGEYDYFRITAGPLTLAQRFAGRAPSRSRIALPLNPYRETA